MRKRLVCLLLCLFLPIFQAAAESVEDALVIGMLSTKTNWIDPFDPVERDIISLYNEVYESLVYIDDDGVPQPHLAESWSETGDGHTWVFTLRENLRFSDGTPLTAYDIEASGKYLLQLAKDESRTSASFYSNIKFSVADFKARDDKTLEVTAYKDHYCYGLLYSMDFPVVPQNQVGQSNPIGSGPYVITSFEPLSYLFLNANPNWWQLQPQVKEITAMFYTNSKDMMTAYEYGRVDAICTRTVSAAQYKSGISSLSIKYSTRQLEVLMINHRSRSFPLDSLNVRKAVRYAINVDKIASNVYMGMTVDADAMVPTDSWLYYDQESTFVYNPDKARALLEEEGWSDLDGNGILDKVVDDTAEEAKHLVLSLYVYEDPDNDVRVETANQIKDMLEAIGFSIHVETRSYSDCRAVLENGTFDLCLCSFQMDTVPDPGFILRKGNVANYGRYTSEAMTKSIDALRQAEQQGAYGAAYAAIQQQFANDVPLISLFYRAGAILTRKMYTTARAIREYELLRGIESFGR